MLRVAILAIGTELTRGELVNTNSPWLSERLIALGFDVLEHRTIDDHLERITQSLLDLAARFDLVFATGGLGPTTDDITAQAAARALGVPLHSSEAGLENIRRRFTALGREMSPSNLKQADLPEGCDILTNVVGTAPGFAIRFESGARMFFMPGVPVEMRTIFNEQIESQIAPHASRTTHQIHLRTFGTGESIIGEKLAGIEASLPGVTIGYRASFPEVEVKVLARAADAALAEQLAERGAKIVRERLGTFVYGDASDTFAGFVGGVLRDRGLRIAVAESCTGGLVGQMITSVPGSSEYLLLDAVTYSNASKIRILGVQEDLIRAYGAVSSEVAAAMAEGAMRITGANFALSITGIAGPGGGTAEKPVGTVWVGLARQDGLTETRLLKLAGERDRVRTLAAYQALQWLADAAVGTRHTP